MTNPYTIAPYRAGDSVAFEPVMPLGEAKRMVYETFMPPGTSHTARCRETDKPVACLGVWHDGGSWRVWATAQKGLGPKSWGGLLRLVDIVLLPHDRHDLRATAGDEKSARSMERFGFEREDRGTDFPAAYIRRAIR